VEINPHGNQFTLRFNHLQPPFNNPKVRQAAMAALNQPIFLLTQVGNEHLFHACFSVYPCSTPYATTKGMEFIAKPNVNRAKQLLKESGYDGAPLVLLQPTDNPLVSKLPVVAAQLLRQAGFTVDLQTMDWQTQVSRRAKKDGWSLLITFFPSMGLRDPISSPLLSGACDKAWFGWPCDAEIERLRDAFARASGEAERKGLAEQVQVRAMEIGSYVPLGEYSSTVAARKSLKNLVTGYSLVLWNVEKD
jgi:peptide/nickel transport system substrate-binding protein